jgi:uncharacterized protein with GYD domain
MLRGDSRLVRPMYPLHHPPTGTGRMIGLSPFLTACCIPVERGYPEEIGMARFIALLDWTDQGVRTAQDSVNRAKEAQVAFQAMGVNMESIYWTLGAHDLVAILTAPDGETIAAALLKVAAAGNLRSQLLRAFDASEFESIVAKLG